MKPVFLLDENLQPTRNELKSPKFLHLREVVHRGTPDWLLLEKAKERELVIITKDKGLVLRALSENQNVVYEDKNGNRFFFHGQENYLFSESEGIKIDWKYHAKIRKAKKLANMKTSHVSLSGIEPLFFV